MYKLIFSVFALLLLTNSVWAQAETTELLPDNPFYPIKTSFENIVAWFKGFATKTEQINYQLDLANTRLKEAKVLSSQGKTTIATRTLQRYQKHITSAEINAIQVKEVPKKLRLVKRITDFKAEKIEGLKKLPPQVVPHELSVEAIEVKPAAVPLSDAFNSKYGLFLTQAKNECVNANGTWRFEGDFTGCEGVGIENCADHELFREAQELCHDLEGKVNCSLQGVYCKR